MAFVFRPVHGRGVAAMHGKGKRSPSMFPAVSIFPLPGLVLFPRTVLPLHIFEPRYWRLVTDALRGNRRIATANLRKGWEKDYYGAPDVFRTITVARILHDEKLPGNRCNILLEGIERAEVVEEVEGDLPYRRVRYRSVVDDFPVSSRDAVHREMQELLSMADRLAQAAPELRNVLANLENTHRHPGIIADIVAAALVREPYERQSVLEQASVKRRLELVNVQLRNRLVHALADETVEEESQP